MSNVTSRQSFGKLFIDNKKPIILPSEVYKDLHLDDEGKIFEVIVENGRVILEPKFTVPKDEEWFWSAEWQAGEREAEEDIKAGRVSPMFDNAEDAIKYLHSVEHDED
ncbi:AbrB/MazE/SpoVT family DNA-binding domain-containing protein [Desulfosporosinus metallidurans]|uniref:Transcriptional regulator, AbrB family n=1 Tax=Desulfosporosinus metallidurans TaxID=1888891 RepID=A0A1Q8QER4_9FIRM|nr:AbrB/MazE/SpoVT family DNA-binding domain-containing protein [Desulfosporosinus metallidurans]OLN25785.1 transcriptional regulator, AbrB family [Desulfosporosinus metallidurans]